MANLLAALGGAAAGIANALQQQREYNMQQTLLKAQLANMGATSAGSAPDPNDPNAGGGGADAAAGLAAGNPAAALMSGQATPAPSAPMAPPSGPPAATGNTTQAGTSGSPDAAVAATPAPQAGNSTQSGVSQVPTNQADVINLARAAQNGMSGGSASGSNAGGVLAAMKAANTPGMSGTPTPADPVGGINSGLTGAVNDYVGAMRPTGSVDLGNGMKMPTAVPPQQAEVLKALFAAKTQAAMQQQQQQFAAGQEAKGEEFAKGMQTSQFGQQTGMQTAEIASQQKIAAQNAEIRREELQKQLEQMKVMFGFKETAQTNKAMDDITKPLAPLERQATLITHAQDALNSAAGGDPAAVKSALTDAFVAMGPGGQARMTPQLVAISGQAGGGSISDRIDRTAKMLSNGTYPAPQLANLQSALGNELQSVQKQYHGIAVAGVANHPEMDVSDGLKRVSAREGAFFPQASTGPGATGGLEQQAAAAIAKGADPKMVAARLKQMQGQQAAAP